MAKSNNTVIEYRNYDLPIHYPVLLSSGSQQKMSDTPSGKLHFHNCLEIGVCHSGSGHLEVPGGLVPYKAGDVTMILQNMPHATYGAQGAENLWSYIYLDPQELFRGMLPPGWNSQMQSICPPWEFQALFPGEIYPLIRDLAAGVIRELKEQKQNYQFSAKGLLLSLYVEIFRIEGRRGNGGSASNKSAAQTAPMETEYALAIAPALDYIEQNYMQQFGIKQLADLCHWSPTHFRRVFHQIMGTSPLDFLNNTRIEKACHLLRNTEDSILNISGIVGFHSVSSFNRCFMKKMRMSPRDYRKQMLSSPKK